VQLLLARHAELHRLAADRDDDGEGAMLRSVVETDELPGPLVLDLHDAVHLDAQPELQCVLRHLLGELEPCDALEAGVILDEVGVEDLAARTLLFE
jgi:hypothetical protein